MDKDQARHIDSRNTPSQCPLPLQANGEGAADPMAVDSTDAEVEALDKDAAGCVEPKSSGGDNSSSEKNAKRQKTGKVQQKKCLFKGYDDKEKASFKTVITTPAGETRELTAMDNVIQALDHVLDWLVEAKVLSEADINSERVMTTYGFCASLFFEFAWTGKVCVNGKEFRQYSSLRPELQQTLATANEQLSSPFEDGSGPSGSTTESKVVNPLELAAILCKSFLDKPVTAVIWDVSDEPEEQTVKNIAEAMQNKDQIKKIKEFIGSTLHLPIIMHSSAQDAMQQIFSLSSSSSLKLVDILSVICTSINEHISPSWCGLGFDVATAYADRGHFVEDTDKARPVLEVI